LVLNKYQCAKLTKPLWFIKLRWKNPNPKTWIKIKQEIVFWIKKIPVKSITLMVFKDGRTFSSIELSLLFEYWIFCYAFVSVFEKLFSLFTWYLKISCSGEKIFFLFIFNIWIYYNTCNWVSVWPDFFTKWVRIIVSRCAISVKIILFHIFFSIKQKKFILFSTQKNKIVIRLYHF